MRTAEDCLRRAALADLYASRVEFQIVRQRLREIADWWRSQVVEPPPGAPEPEADLYSEQPVAPQGPSGG